MTQAQTPIDAAQHLLGLLHNARRAVALSANLAFQLSLSPGPARSVPAGLVADALNLLSEQLDDAEQAGTALEDMLLHPVPGADPAGAAGAARPMSADERALWLRVNPWERYLSADWPAPPDAHADHPAGPAAQPAPHLAGPVSTPPAG